MPQEETFLTTAKKIAVVVILNLALWLFGAKLLIYVYGLFVRPA